MFKMYKVGGCVRDQLLGITPRDIDYTVVLQKQDNEKYNDNDITIIYNLLCDYLIEHAYIILAKNPKCFTIKAKNTITKEAAEFVLARKEISYDQDSRSPNISTIGTLNDDLIRRDFTINTLAINIETNEIIDICNGLSDLENKVLRTPLDAQISLINDPLRILRGMRFSITKNFKLDPSFFMALKNEKLWDKFTKVVSQERIKNELDQMFKYDTIATLNMLYQIKEIDNSYYETILKNIMLKPCCGSMSSNNK